MCLYTKNIKSFIAKKDIKVIKVLRKTKDGYFTPYHFEKVNLNSLLKPNKEINYNKGNYGINEDFLRIGEGFIHATLDTIKDNVYMLNDKLISIEAYIPKGTEFYIDEDINNICSKELFITENTCDPNLNNRELQEIYSYIFERYINTEYISIGYFYTSDNQFIHPYHVNDTNKKNVIGIVCGVDDSDYIIMALNESKQPFIKNSYLCNYIGNSTISNSTVNVLKDMNGKQNSEKILSKNISDYKACKYCNDYKTNGTNQGDWYLPSCGELWNYVLNNYKLINTIIQYSNIGIPLKRYNYYWTSTEVYNYFASCLDLYIGRLLCEKQTFKFYVRPFLRIKK